MLKGIQACCGEPCSHRLSVLLQDIYMSSQRMRPRQPRGSFKDQILAWHPLQGDVNCPLITLHDTGFTKWQAEGGAGQWEPQRVLVGHMEQACLRFSWSVIQVLLQVEGHEGLGDAIAFQHWALGSVHGGHGQEAAGQGTAALINVAIGVLDDCTVGTLHGHSYIMNLALLAAGALMLHGLSLHGVLGHCRAGALAEGDVDCHICFTALIPQDGCVYVHLTCT